MPPWIDFKITPANLVTFAGIGLAFIITVAVRAHEIDDIKDIQRFQKGEIQSIKNDLIVKEQKDKANKETIQRVEQKLDFLTDMLLTRSQKP